MSTVGGGYVRIQQVILQTIYSKQVGAPFQSICSAPTSTTPESIEKGFIYSI